MDISRTTISTAKGLSEKVGMDSLPSVAKGNGFYSLSDLKTGRARAAVDQTGRRALLLGCALKNGKTRNDPQEAVKNRSSRQAHGSNHLVLQIPPVLR